MKSVEIGEVKGALADDARDAQRETIVVTRRGRPVAAVVATRGVDMESLALCTHPDFIGRIERARACHKSTGGEEMRRRWGAERKPRRRRARASPSHCGFSSGSLRPQAAPPGAVSRDLRPRCGSCSGGAQGPAPRRES